MILLLQKYLEQNQPEKENPIEIPSGNILRLYNTGNEESDCEAGCGCVVAGDKAFYVHALFYDSDIFNQATQSNIDPTWKLGDVMEFYLQLPGHKDYYEFHVSPDNVILQLHLPCNERQYIMNYENNIFQGGLQSKVQSIPEENLWYAEMVLPYSNFDISAEDVKGSRFAICRYNYYKGHEEPETSSTAKLSGRRFHNPECWHVLSV